MGAVGHFLKRLIVWLLTLAVAVVAVIFAINNRDAVSLDFSPLGLALEVPVFAVFFIGLLLGAAVAAAIGGWTLMRVRIALASARREAAAASRQLEHARARGAELETRLQASERASSHATRPGDPPGLPAVRPGAQD